MLQIQRCSLAFNDRVGDVNAYGGVFGKAVFGDLDDGVAVLA